MPRATSTETDSEGMVPCLSEADSLERHAAMLAERQRIEGAGAMECLGCGYRQDQGGQCPRCRGTAWERPTHAGESARAVDKAFNAMNTPAKGAKVSPAPSLQAAGATRRGYRQHAGRKERQE
jgi:hypothetical protein